MYIFFEFSGEEKKYEFHLLEIERDLDEEGSFHEEGENKTFRGLFCFICLFTCFSFVDSLQVNPSVVFPPS